MIIEVNPYVILGAILAFLAGMSMLYLYYKVSSLLKSNKETSNMAESERFSYYENQLIDMKIRMDALDMLAEQDDGSKSDINPEIPKITKKPEDKTRTARKVIVPEKQEIVPEKTTIVTVDTPSTSITNPTNHILYLITNKAMTSRDIQITLKKSREHTSRLMKKLFEAGLVERDINAKPYKYSITEKGKERLNHVDQ